MADQALFQEAFEGKIAVVTGAASGIGLETAVQLARAGATVVAADIDADRLEEASGRIAKSGGQIEAVVVDVAKVNSIRQLVDGVVESHGCIDYMFNNAGIGGTAGEVRDLTPDDWTETSISTCSASYTARALPPLTCVRGAAGRSSTSLTFAKLGCWTTEHTIRPKQIIIILHDR